MIEVRSYFSKYDINKVLEILLILPEAIRPTHFSDRDDVVNSKNLISDKNRFKTFLEKNSTGFFVQGKNGIYNLNISSKKIDLYLPDKFQEYIQTFFEAITPLNPDFAYAADDEEREHRNRCYKTIGINQIESWVGRDINKYVPGLYCCTLLSKNLLDKHNINLKILLDAATSHKILDREEQFHFFRFFENTKMWKTEAQKLDQLCFQVEGIFSIKNVIDATEDIDNYLDYSDIISEWH